MCADAGKKAKQALDGNYSYNAYDYHNTNYLLNFGAGFLDAFRPYNANMQAWGVMRTVLSAPWPRGERSLNRSLYFEHWLNVHVR